MTTDHRDERPHIMLGANGLAEPFTSPRGGGSPPGAHPLRDRQDHANDLLGQMRAVRYADAHVSVVRTERGIDEQEGIILEFDSEPGFDLKLDSMDSDSTRGPAGIELLAVREVGSITRATVFVPHGRLQWLVERIEQYRDQNWRDTEKPMHQALVARIAQLRKVALRSLWTDDDSLFPDAGQHVWWEVWLRAGRDRLQILTAFQRHAGLLGIRVQADSKIEFVDRTVVLAWATPEEMGFSVELLDCFAELRRAKELAGDYTDMAAHEQAEWGRDLLERLRQPAPLAPAVCLLDSGLNEHPMLEGLVTLKDTALASRFGVDDQHGHGTEMAGIAAFGDYLPDLLAGTATLQLEHVLESVKLYQQPGTTEPDLYGYVTQQGAYTAETEAPTRQRTFCLTITSRDSRDGGLPSSWSAAVDKLVAAEGEGPDWMRVLLASAGNVEDWQQGMYPYACRADGVHDPGQSWNAITVGAYTEKVRIDPGQYPGWRPVAPAGRLSPTTTTSVSWDRDWPLKPDIVMEGGNAAIDPATGQPDFVDSLRLLTTYRRPMRSWFTTTGDTSAATAQAASIAATIQARYPHLHPETVRALLLHSAEWTPAMLQEVQGDKKLLVRSYGHGVPQLSRALWSARDSLTLVVEDELQPFVKVSSSNPKANEMKVHPLPWPRDILLGLMDTEVEMRVTLSYYIEPNPGRRGWKSRFVYPSHQLRFDVRRANESLEAFRERVNKAARDEGLRRGRGRTPPDEGWDLGTQLRHRGSLHQDTWRGMAADLANRGVIAVYPAAGWWKTRKARQQWDRKARYSLVVTIRTPAVDVDIYTPVAVEAGIPVEV